MSTEGTVKWRGRNGIVRSLSKKVYHGGEIRQRVEESVFSDRSNGNELRPSVESTNSEDKNRKWSRWREKGKHKTFDSEVFLTILSYYL